MMAMKERLLGLPCKLLLINSVHIQGAAVKLFGPRLGHRKPVRVSILARNRGYTVGFKDAIFHDYMDWQLHTRFAPY